MGYDVLRQRQYPQSVVVDGNVLPAVADGTTGADAGLLHVELVVCLMNAMAAIVPRDELLQQWF